MNQFIVNHMAKKLYKANCDNRGIDCMLTTFGIPSHYKVIFKDIPNTGIGSHGYTQTSSTLNNPNTGGYMPRPRPIPRPSTGGLGGLGGLQTTNNNTGLQITNNNTGLQPVVP